MDYRFYNIRMILFLMRIVRGRWLFVYGIL